MKLTPRRKYILCVVAAVYMVGLSIEVWRNYHFHPTEAEVVAVLQQRCQAYGWHWSESDWELVQEPVVTQRICADSDWSGTYRHMESGVELDLIIESDGEVFSLVEP